jgi:metal-responsive CopG/Arc/MetJ family transcriptional regulator
MQVGINLPKSLIDEIDRTRGEQSRSAFVVYCINQHLNHESEMTSEVVILQNEIAQLRDELGFLRHEYSKVNDALATRLLSEAKLHRSFLDRIRRRQT